MSVTYSDRTETEQDATGVEAFTNAVGDADIVQKLLDLAHQADSVTCHKSNAVKATQHDWTENPGCCHQGRHRGGESRDRCSIPSRHLGA